MYRLILRLHLDKNMTVSLTSPASQHQDRVALEEAGVQDGHPRCVDSVALFADPPVQTMLGCLQKPATMLLVVWDLEQFLNIVCLNRTLHRHPIPRARKLW